jgi:hypothetical protein
MVVPIRHFICLVPHPYVAFIFFEILVRSRVSRPETKISNGIVRLGAFDTVDRFGPTVLGYTIPETLALKLIWPDAKYGGYSVRGEHNG